MTLEEYIRTSPMSALFEIPSKWHFVYTNVAYDLNVFLHLIWDKLFHMATNYAYHMVKVQEHATQ